MNLVSSLIDYIRWPQDSEARQMRSRFRSVNQKIIRARYANHATNPPPVKLIAVSKTKPASHLMSAYKTGVRVFGESYVDEICDKASSLPKDVEWHFVGHLQSRKAQRLVKSVPNLALVHSVESRRLAKKLNQVTETRVKEHPECGKTLGILLQVNINGDSGKHGLPATTEDIREMAEYVKTECPFLKVKGLMTIGSPSKDTDEESQDRVAGEFIRMRLLRDDLAEYLNVPSDQLELSMGMSQDYPLAIQHGATLVRVGTSLFGARQYPPKTEKKSDNEKRFASSVGLSSDDHNDPSHKVPQADPEKGTSVLANTPKGFENENQFSSLARMPVTHQQNELMRSSIFSLLVASLLLLPTFVFIFMLNKRLRRRASA